MASTHERGIEKAKAETVIVRGGEGRNKHSLPLRPRLPGLGITLFSKVTLIALTLQYYLDFVQITLQEMYFCDTNHYRSKAFKEEDIQLHLHVKDYQKTVVSKNSFQH